MTGWKRRNFVGMALMLKPPTVAIIVGVLQAVS